jgi:putative tributyrin esterase
MPRIIIFCITLLFCFTSEWVVAQRMWISDSLPSAATGDMRNLRVILPENPDKEQRYPILYLLHGYTGDHTNWTARTRLLNYLDSLKLQIVVVMPDADNSFYQNTMRGKNYDAFIRNELPAWSYTHYQADTSRQYIAGLSMGGYGALYFAMSNPQRYLMAGSFSGAVSFPNNTLLMDQIQSLEVTDLKEAFGPQGHPNRTKGDLFGYTAAYNGIRRPFLYLTHGRQDEFIEFLPAHRKLVNRLSASGWPHLYQERDGRHNWAFWDQSIKEFLILLTASLQQSR